MSPARRATGGQVIASVVAAAVVVAIAFVVVARAFETGGTAPAQAGAPSSTVAVPTTTAPAPDGARPAPIDSTAAIAIVDFGFNPASVAITVGGAVTWTNTGNANHTVTAEGMFDSGPLKPGATFQQVFTQAGTYNYVCTIHSRMQATLIVGASTQAPFGESTPGASRGPGG